MSMFFKKTGGIILGFEIISTLESSLQKQAILEIRDCNDFTEKYGVVLTDDEAIDLVKTRSIALQKNGRIEFGGGIIHKIIKALCDSPYISMQNYAETLHELLELFYYFKNETFDLISDNDLIQYMEKAFNSSCQGSLEILAGRELNRLVRKLHNGNVSDDGDNILDYEENPEGKCYE